MRLFLLLLSMTWSLPAFAQTFRYEVFDSDHILPDVHAQRRARVLASLPPGSVAVVQAADVRNRQNDVDYEYRQNSNLLYLTGYPHPGAVLVLCADGIAVGDTTVTEVLFVPERNQSSEQWTGVTAGPQEAMAVYGLQMARPTTALVPTLDRLFADERGQDGSPSPQPRRLYLDGWPTKSIALPLLGRNMYIDTEVKRALRERYGNLSITPKLAVLDTLREVKDTAELRLLRKAVAITIDGHRRAMQAAKPGMKEYQIEAFMEFGFKHGGAEDVGYPSIVGSSYNACILHYTTNRRAMTTGDLILADCGAEYHGYTADITRTFPLSGTFTDDQRAIYAIVLEAQDSGIAACTVGAAFRAPHEAAARVIGRGLAALGIISDAEDPAQIRAYFMHGTSHYLGLDVHDAGTRGPLRENTVLTVEPGIYIAEGSPCDPRWWNIGVRIEDDILVTATGPENLSASLERTSEDIELLMNQTMNRTMKRTE